MENLEILGDCFLKLAVSMALFYRLPLANVGQLTNEKNQEISNENLYQLTVVNEFKDYLYADKIVFQGDEKNWLPPGYVNSLERYTHQKVKRKAFADMLEALIGVFLMSSDFISTIQFLNSIGLKVIPFDEQGRVIEQSIMRSEEMRKIYYDERFEEIEKILNYNFREKTVLVLAFTHSSISNHHSYERLEFFGDALLDFLVVRYAFLNYERDFTPGRITNIRQDLVNNNRLAEILVSLNLHTKIRYQSNGLTEQIRIYLMKRNESTYLKAPKILADVFEALIAAIFLDSKNSLEILWKILEPFLGKYFSKLNSNLKF